MSLRLNPWVANAPVENFTPVFDVMHEPEFLGLAWAEHYHAAPAHAVAAYRAAIDEGFVRYGSNEGDPELRDAIVRKMRQANGMEVDARTQVQVTHGAGQALAMAFQAVLSPGSEIIGFTPSFPLNWGLPAIHGAALRTVPISTPADRLRAVLDAEVTERTRAIIMHNPNNPTGHVMTREHLEAISAVAIDRDLVVISDEVYECFRYDGRPHVSIGSLPGMLDRTISIYGFAKEYGLSGLRVGYAVGGDELIDAIRRIQHNANAGANSAGQRAAMAALESPLDEVEGWVREFQGARDVVVTAIGSSESLRTTTPEGGMFAMVDVGDWTGTRFTRELLREKLVALAPGSWYGPEADHFVRLCFPALAPARLAEALERVISFADART